MENLFDKKQIENFINDGYICIENAFDRRLADEARKILWQDIDASPDDPTTWTKPVVRLGWYHQEPFVQAANTTVLHEAFNQLVGEGKWTARNNLGSFPVRFPSADDPGDTGWHVDSGFPGANPQDFFDWRVNIRSKGRALLMLFLFSDVGERDAPTRIRAGSHLDVAKLLLPAGEEGLSFMELAGRLTSLPERNEVLATGAAGTVYLCHPFMAHAAQSHSGLVPRFLAQPPLELKEEFALTGASRNVSPVERAILIALGKG